MVDFLFARFNRKLKERGEQGFTGGETGLKEVE